MKILFIGTLMAIVAFFLFTSFDVQTDIQSVVNERHAIIGSIE